MGKRRELDWYKPFLQALREGVYVIDTCQLVGVPRRPAYNHRKRNRSFATRWQRAAQRGMLARARRSAQLAYCRRILNDGWPLMRRAVHELRSQGATRRTRSSTQTAMLAAASCGRLGAGRKPTTRSGFDTTVVRRGVGRQRAWSRSTHGRAGARRSGWYNVGVFVRGCQKYSF